MVPYLPVGEQYSDRALRSLEVGETYLLECSVQGHGGLAFPPKIRPGS